MTQLNESSLSRVWRNNENHDCAALTAFRKASDCGEGETYTNRENLQRNKSLLAKLQSRGYGVTRLQGKYPEGGKETTEISFFVVDLKDSGNLFDDIRALGQEFEQDSVLLIPRGAVQNESQAYLIGTNNCENNFMSMGETMPFEKGKLGYGSPIYTSYVNGRPFMFEDVKAKEQKLPGSGMGLWAMNKIAEIPWQDISLDEEVELSRMRKLAEIDDE